MPTRSLYRRPLSVDRTEFLAPARSPSAADLDGLSRLMLDAYTGTIDYEGETIEEARMAVAEYLDESPILDCSFVVDGDTGPRAAMLVSTWSDGQPLISYAITDPIDKRAGLASALLARTLAALAAAGHTHVHAVITNGNTPSERLLRRAGFEVVETFDGGN